MGRKRIKIEPIKGERSRAATFQKRKTGLFKKAHELAILTESNVAVIIFNENGKLSEFCSSNMEDFLLRYADYRGVIDRRGPENFATAEPHSTETKESSDTLASWKGDLDSADFSQSPTDNFQSRRFSSDSRSSMDYSPQILPFSGSFSMAEHGREAISPTSVSIPPPKVPHVSTSLDVNGSSMSSEDSYTHSNGHEMHQVFHQGNHIMHPSITKLPNGRMVPAMSVPIPHGRRWSSAHELELSSQVSPITSSFDDRRFTTTPLSYPPNHNHLGGDMLNSRVVHTPVEQPAFGPEKSLPLGSSYPVSNPNFNVAAFGQAPDFSSRRSSLSIHSPHSQTYSPLSPPVSTSHGYPGNHYIPESMETKNSLYEDAFAFK